MTTQTQTQSGTIPAAGAVLWRRKGMELQVALVHRPKYDDWSWPKGKLEEDEAWTTAAAREVAEETGLVPRLGMPLPTSVYVVPRDRMKEVRYWAAEVAGGSGALEHEIDEVLWLTVPDAHAKLTYERDALQLQAVAKADRQDVLETWPLIVVRHAEAVGRSHWSEDDLVRPLNHTGSRRSTDLVPLLSAYGVSRVVTSDAVRCVDTVAPYAKFAHVDLRRKGGLSEDGFESNPKKVLQHVDRALDRANPVALCTHRPLLPSMLARLYDQAIPGSLAEELLVELARTGLEKGEAIVCQVVGSGPGAKVVTVERHLPNS
ncbi:NUDIX hydrolase [Leekyejoonella antrihumi]|uniref:NUDIX hydrolase n=1 Tax=Leekyejoonella antrihumi TaxID=1660198 RepID=A0A563E8J3_9MICO|nr:NUDIX hydrolase [Leekyejoonella antrihumi]TWP38898.1 NUDIX hydrolase [Leekyejoonella antrihumi]